MKGSTIPTAPRYAVALDLNGQDPAILVRPGTPEARKAFEEMKATASKDLEAKLIEARERWFTEGEGRPLREHEQRLRDATEEATDAAAELSRTRTELTDLPEGGSK